jgi:NAD(P)-dependent dehydrogenase (short-subunit alcohol dehydrogenase family)
MRGKTIVITGATSGIGEVAAHKLAAKGARIIFTARDKRRGEDTLSRLKAIGPNAAHQVYYADLSKLAEMKRVGNEIAAAEPKIDVLVNNAGATYSDRHVTEDGLELSFALNHMSYFVLTALLRPRIGSGGRIVSTSSSAYAMGKLDFDDLQLAKHYSEFPAYAASKLCNVLFTRELASRLQGSGVTANCFHPGIVKTAYGAGSRGFAKLMMNVAMLFAISPDKGSETLVYLASSPNVDGVSGCYFYKCEPQKLAKVGENEADAKKLWDASAQIAGLGG